MIVLDTTVLVYAIGTEHPLRGPARRLITLIGESAVRATTTVEVIQEFAHVRARRRSRSDAAARAGEYAIGLAPLVRPDNEDLHEGLALFGTSEGGLGAFDAVLAATARRRGWALASADRSFHKVGGLAFLDLFSPGFLAEAAKAG